MKTLTFILCLAVATTLLSCKKKSSKNKNELIVAIQSEPATLDPRFTTGAVGMRLANLMFSSFVKVGKNLEIAGDAAESWSYKDKVYTFLLRPGLRFSDGSPVTPDDIHFTFKQYQAETSPFKAALKSIKKVIANYRNEEEKKQIQVQFYLDNFTAPLLSDLYPIKILPKKLVTQHGKDFNKILVGSGSFKLVKQTASEIVLDAIKDHPWETPKIDRVTFKIIRDDNTLYLKTLKGAIDLSQAQIPLNKVKSLESKSDFKVHKSSGLSMTYLIFNLKDDALKKLSTRQAFAHAINRQEIIDYKFDGLASPATSILPPESSFHPKSLSTPEFSIDKAQELVKKYQLTGQPFILKTSNSPETVETAKVIANQLRKAGLEVKVQSFEWGTYYKDVKSGNFQIALMRWVGTLDPDIYRTAFHSSQFPPGRNRGYYKNPQVDQMLEEGVSIEDLAKRIKHYEKVQKIIMQDLPTLPLWYRTQVSVTHQRVQNYDPHINGDYSPLTQLSLSEVNAK